MKITDFKKHYKGHTVQMKDIDCDKRIIVFKGENGSGKSTLLKAMTNIIVYNGTILSKGTISYMNELIHFPKDSTVMEIVNALNVIDKASDNSISKLIDQFGMKDKISEKYSSLSKGMKMKLQLICSFLIDRDIYVLDEPFSGLDKTAISTLVNYINDSKKRFVITTHIDVTFSNDCEVIKV